MSFVPFNFPRRNPPRQSRPPVREQPFGPSDRVSAEETAAMMPGSNEEGSVPTRPRRRGGRTPLPSRRQPRARRARARRSRGNNQPPRGQANGPTNDGPPPIPENPQDDDDDHGDENPPANEPNRTTVGIELEFWLAVCQSDSACPDPHSAEDRWLCRELIDIAEGPEFGYTCRNRIIDELRLRNIVAVKNLDLQIEDEGPNYPWWHSLEYESRPDPHGPLLGNWRGVYTGTGDVEATAVDFVQQFADYHAQNNLRFAATKFRTLETVRQSIPAFLQGTGITAQNANDVANRWLEIARTTLRDEKHTYERGLARATDPHAVMVNGSNSKYWSWHCTKDASVGGNDINPEDYNVPPTSIPRDPRTGDPWGWAPEIYRWFSAEVISPIYDFNNPITWNNLRNACGALRDALRIHKPSQ
ncbi:hypothetical protein F5Y15DRAFT_429932 [Xylariaceae sp. FL0016]|nr:hypothetical protein F5Y15DRAFT_429932 [Xylariaceae sp. FL0016]